MAATITTDGLPAAPGASSSALNVSAATVIKASAGLVVAVNVTTAGSTNGAIYDQATTSGTGVATQVAAIPESVGTYVFYSFPCFTGIVVVPGTGMVCSVAFS